MGATECFTLLLTLLVEAATDNDELQVVERVLAQGSLSNGDDEPVQTIESSIKHINDIQYYYF